MRERLINWGLWAQQSTAPQGYPNESPMFKYAPKSQWWEEGWGDNEAAPAEITPPVDEIDAYELDRLITKLDQRLKIALLIAYAEAPKVFRFRRFGFDESVAEAERVLKDMLNPSIASKTYMTREIYRTIAKVMLDSPA